MILLSVICALLYVLGGLLANAMYDVWIETERTFRNHPAKRLVTVLFWPSLAFFLTFHRGDE